MKYLIFDFDGVLGDTDSARTQVMKKMEDKTEEQIAKEKDEYFTQSPHTRSSNLSQSELEDYQVWMAQYGKLLHQQGFDLFSGFIEELRKIKNAKMAIVSSGSSVYIKPRLEKSGLAFTDILSFEDHHSKEEKVETICKNWGIPVKEAYFFTDTISDIRELENIMDKEKIYGCAWGYQGKEKLMEELDEKHILVDFSDIQNVFKK